MEHSGKPMTESNMSDIINLQGFTKSQCEELIHMFHSIHNGKSTASGSENHSANMAGIASSFHAFTSHFSPLTSNPWIIDSGASQHMTYDKSLLHDIKYLPTPVSVTLPNSYKVTIDCLMYSFSYSRSSTSLCALCSFF